MSSTIGSVAASSPTSFTKRSTRPGSHASPARSAGFSMMERSSSGRRFAMRTMPMPSASPDGIGRTVLASAFVTSSRTAMMTRRSGRFRNRPSIRARIPLRSAGSKPICMQRSNLSTKRTLRRSGEPVRGAESTASSADAHPGSTTRRSKAENPAVLRSVGNTPAATNDVLPLADGPTTHTRLPRVAASNCACIDSRPKKNGACSSKKGSSPR